MTSESAQRRAGAGVSGPPGQKAAGGRGPAGGPALVPTPLWAALRRAGTRHLYGDTADRVELEGLLHTDGGGLRREVDGNTANQPLVRKVIARVLDDGATPQWLAREAEGAASAPRPARLPRLYALVCARIGADLTRAFAAGRTWEVSLQLHMGLCGRDDEAREIGRLLHRRLPNALVKVPFTPDAPGCFLVARDLEREGIAVNFTSTFSARQALAAALLSDVTRTNVFLGRLNQGLEAELLGEHVALEAQRGLVRARREDGVRTQLIVASVHDWRTLVRLAGCDVFTAPCDVLEQLRAQEAVPPERITSQLGASFEDRLGVSARVQERLGQERLAHLARVDHAFVEFLRDLRRSPEYQRERDPDALFARFDAAGFGDLFHAPSAAEREALADRKLPDLDEPLVLRLPLDTHFSLLANGDFARAQREIDVELEKRNLT